MTSWRPRIVWTMADVKPHNNGMIFSESFGGRYSHRRYLVVGDTVRRSDRGSSGIGIKERGVKILKVSLT